MKKFLAFISLLFISCSNVEKNFDSDFRLKVSSKTFQNAEIGEIQFGSDGAYFMLNGVKYGFDSTLSDFEAVYILTDEFIPGKEVLVVLKDNNLILKDNGKDYLFILT